MKLQSTTRTLKLRIFSIGFILVLFLNFMLAQNLSTYRWENRLLLLISQGGSQDLEFQVAAIRSDTSGLAERKLKVLLITEEGYYLGPSFDELISDTLTYEKYHKLDRPFEMVLIGLDGSIKKRYGNQEPLKQIFALIDGMPMRKSEIKKKKE